LNRASLPPKHELDTELEAVLARIDIDPDDLEDCQPITDSLIACFNVKGDTNVPRKQIIHYLKWSTAPAAVAYLEAWKKVSKRDRDRIPVEAICLLADVSPLEILGAIFQAARQVKGQESALRSVLRHPDVVDMTIETALLLGPAGDTSRRMLHEATTFLPTRNGQSIAINLGAPPKGKEEDSDDEDDEKFDEAFPNISTRLEEWSEDRRRLTDGK